MAQLTQKEFRHSITLLANDIGLQRLRDKFVKLNALVTRRKVASPDSLADQLFMLTSGLRRQVPATFAFHALWAEHLQAKLGEDGEKELEKLADAVNACLGEDEQIIAEKGAELDSALATYEQALSTAVGPDLARIDMLMKAVPAVAEKLRAAPLATPAPAAEAAPATDTPAE